MYQSTKEASEKQTRNRQERSEVEHEVRNQFR